MNDLTSANAPTSTIGNTITTEMMEELKKARVSSFRALDEFLKKRDVPKDEQLSRNNIYIAPLDWFYIEPGFNLRPIDPEHAGRFANSMPRGVLSRRLWRNSRPLMASRASSSAKGTTA